LLRLLLQQNADFVLWNRCRDPVFDQACGIKPERFSGFEHTLRFIRTHRMAAIDHPIHRCSAYSCKYCNIFDRGAARHDTDSLNLGVQLNSI
jgi:hypothetical protein